MHYRTVSAIMLKFHSIHYSSISKAMNFSESHFHRLFIVIPKRLYATQQVEGNSFENILNKVIHF